MWQRIPGLRVFFMAEGDPPSPPPQGDPPPAPPPQPPPPAAPPDPGAPPPAAAQPTWYDRRIAQQTAQLHDLRARLEEAERRATPPAPPAATPPAPPPGHVPQSEVDRLANEKAAQIAANQRFADACMTADAQGVAAFPETWRQRVESLKRIAGSDAEAQRNYNDLINTAIETGSGPALIHELGGNLDEAMRLLTLPPVKRGMELQKKAAAVIAPEASAGRATSAPRPITPVGSRGPSHTQIAPDDPEAADRLDIDTWMARRTTQIKDRGGEPWARNRA